MKTKIKQCNCVHKYQDEVYGANQRVHNLKEANRKPTGWSCTVCNAIKPIGSNEFAKVEVVKGKDEVAK